MSPEAKKFLSAVLVAVAAAVIGVLQTYVVKLPPEIVAVVAPILAGLAHYVSALGHAERVHAKALELTTAAINQERERS